MSNTFFYALFTIFMTVVTWIVIGAPSERRQEHQARRTVCHQLAADVRNGKASAMSYMATRCPARFLEATATK